MPEESVQHGSETFFVEGEGVLTTQVGGRSGTETDPLDESDSPPAAAPKRLAATDPPPFRFSRVGPKGTAFPKAATRTLARAMSGAGGGKGNVPAGYTYLGQFIDHDLTMDKTKVMFGHDVSPTDLLQGRSPRLDLDSLYGAGPANAGSAAFYEADGLHLKVGTTISDDGGRPKVAHDLPRTGKGKPAERRKALIPDPRNDENLIVAQTHLAMIRFHNAVADKVPASVPQAQRFARARKRVTLHYQWLIRHDYLPRIVRPVTLDRVWKHGRVLVEPDAAPTDVPTMPIEFSIAAFRLGHSMVRPTYDWNRVFSGDAGGLEYMFAFSALGGDLGGNPRLVNTWLADWRRMYDFPAAGRPDLAGPNGVNRAMRIDTRLADPLKDLPPSTFGGKPTMPDGDLRRNLAFRNLVRANMVKLASGQQMVAKLAAAGVDVEPLTRDQILKGSGGAKLDGLTTAEQDALVARTPLWFYVLREAELNRGRLRGVGGRLVAETFHRAMEGSRFSIVRDPAWRPDLGRDATTFEMTDLLLFAFGGKKTGLNPLGGK